MRVLDENKLCQLKEFIHSYVRTNNGDYPTLTMIMDEMNMVKSVAYRYVMALKERGFIEYDGKNSMAFPDETNYLRRYNAIKTPIYGSVICGSPEDEEQYNEGYLAIPEEWIKGECFLLRARGDSMIGIGVNDGDLLLVQKTAEALNGQHVIALTENGNTFKTYYNENGRVRLHPENPEYKDIYPKELTMQGIVLKVIKDMA